MAFPAIAWGVGALILWAMKSDAPPKQQQTPNDGGSGTNAAPPAEAPNVRRIQTALLALGFRGDGALQVNGKEDISTQLAIQAYWKATPGGFIPLTYAQLAARLEAELAGQPPPSTRYAPPPELVARIQKALATLGFKYSDDYFLSKGEFPPDSLNADSWNALATRLEHDAGLIVAPDMHWTRIGTKTKG